MSLADHIDRARTAVDAALGHHSDAVDAYDRDDPVAAKQAHANLRRCLRTAQECFRAIAADQEVNGKTKNVQTSDGVGESGGSANGRAGRSPLMTGNVQGWLDRARVGARHR